VTSLRQLADLTDLGSWSFRAIEIRRGTQILNLEVERGGLGVTLGLARVEPVAAAAPSSSAPADPPARSP
jgi:hypothetical protein